MAEKRFRSFTFKIDIDYIARGLQVQKRQADEAEIYKHLVRSFGKFIKSYDGMQGVAKLHDEDFKMDKKSKKFILDKNGNRIPDDNHVHFVVWGAKMAFTEKQWREKLAKNGLKLSDEKRQVKDFEILLKKNLGKAIAYLLHRTPQSIKDGKHAYDEKDLICFNVKPDQIHSLLIKGGLAEHGKSLVDTEMVELADKLTLQVRKGLTIDDAEKLSIKKFGDQQPQFWRKFSKDLQKEAIAYSHKLFSQLTYRKRFFNFIYIQASGGTGKSRTVDQMAWHFADVTSHRVHAYGTQGKKKTPDLLSSYTGELVTVAHELKPTAMNVDEFENNFEPNRYPASNSRGHDKRYFAQAMLVAQSMDLRFWAYALMYSDYLRDDYATLKYGWKKTIKNKADGKAQKEEFEFPPTYALIMKLFTKPENHQLLWKEKHVFPDGSLNDLEHDYHWSLAGAESFLDDWWQILRRLTYWIKAKELPDGSVQFSLYKLDEKTKPACLLHGKSLSDGNEFFEELRFENHYKHLGDFRIDDVRNNLQITLLVSSMVRKMQESGTIIEKHLPPLMPDEKFYEYQHTNSISAEYDFEVEMNNIKDLLKDKYSEEASLL